QQQRLIAGNVLQTIQILSEVVLVVNVHVVTAEIDVRRIEEFCSGIIHISRKTIRCMPLNSVNEFVDESFDALVLVEAHNVRGNLVGNTDGEQSWMITQSLRRILNDASRANLRVPILKKAAMLFPRHIDEDPQSVIEGFVQQPPRGRRVDAEAISSELSHVRE